MLIGEHATLVTDYEQLALALRRRRQRLGLTMNELDDRSGLQLGYTAKLENFSHENSGRFIGPVSLPLWLGALGLAIVLVPVKSIRRLHKPDPAQLALPLEGGGMNPLISESAARQRLIEDVKRRNAA